ncbi:PTS sugar transporter subunit IIC [Apilactobacillus kunkeei]|uniref:PTS transporter subunit IIC n=1 Tax=Apilactobacillus kunkeei TaxID=148814 RepID=UPI00110CE324|nr:PTS sugar transporter subunit IIC [Apilactobacillus kunkeei]TMT00366.1 PTS sugar transporter subunit IIC [Apilactobacillus kunkeei]
MIDVAKKDDPQINKVNSLSSAKENIFLIVSGVSNAIFVTLGIGMLIVAIANLIHWSALNQIGLITQVLMAPAIGAAVAHQLKTNTLVMFSSMITATVGANNVFFSEKTVNAVTVTGHLLSQPIGSSVFMIGQPISALGGAIIATLIGKKLSGKTPLDMFLVPFCATMFGSIIALGLAAITTPALVWISKIIAKSMIVNPFVGSISVALVWSIFLMTPASSAALAIAIMLDPLSSGAALLGTTAQYVSYTVMSFRVNRPGANIAQGLITPKVQFGNITKNPYILIPGMVSSAIVAPIGTMLFHFSTTYKLAGLGTNSLIVPLNFASQSLSKLTVYIILGIIMPSIISITMLKILKACHKVKEDDMKMHIV